MNRLYCGCQKKHVHRNYYEIKEKSDCDWSVGERMAGAMTGVDLMIEGEEE